MFTRVETTRPDRPAVLAHSDLKPCRLCGRDPKFATRDPDGEVWWVECKPECGVSVTRHDLESVVSAWNALHAP